jgi:hypothetical protein
MMRNAHVILACALLGCSASGSANDRFGNRVAEKFAADCTRADAPTPEAGKVLIQLCSCSTKMIRSTVRDGDSDRVVNDKIETARRACLRKAYPNGI